ncbi:MAG: DUF4349 domain-containing protein [Ferruginibacter sp.]
MNLKRPGAVLLLCVMAFSCHQRVENKSETAKDSMVPGIVSAIPDETIPAATDSMDEPEPQQFAPPQNNGPQQNNPPAQKPVSPPVNPDWDKKIIKNATLKLEVKNFREYNTTVHDKIKKYGAYIANENNTYSGDQTETNLTIKVPVAQFEDLLNELSTGESKTIERRISTDDVTAQVIDTKARLEAKKEMRLKYLEFLRQSKNITEALEVQGEINGIQEEIESAATRIQALRQQAALSTINLGYYQPVAGFVPPAPGEKPSYITRLAASFKTGASWLGELLVALATLWPLWIVLGGGLFIYRRKFAGVSKVSVVSKDNVIM